MTFSLVILTTHYVQAYNKQKFCRSVKNSKWRYPSHDRSQQDGPNVDLTHSPVQQIPEAQSLIFLPVPASN